MGRVNEANGALEVGFDFESDDAPEPVHGAHGDGVIGMAFQARVPNFAHLGVRFEVPGQGQPIAVVSLHAQGQGFESAQQQPSSVAVDDTAEDAQGLADRIHDFLGAGHGAREQIVVAAQVFRCAVDDQVRVLGQRSVVDRGGKG